MNPRLVRVTELGGAACGVTLSHFCLVCSFVLQIHTQKKKRKNVSLNFSIFGFRYPSKSSTRYVDYDSEVETQRYGGRHNLPIFQERVRSEVNEERSVDAKVEEERVESAP